MAAKDEFLSGLVAKKARASITSPKYQRNVPTTIYDFPWQLWAAAKDRYLLDTSTYLPGYIVYLALAVVLISKYFKYSHQKKVL